MRSTPLTSAPHAEKTAETLARKKEEYRVLKARLEQQFGLVDHPKRTKVFEMAWERGHGAGLTEVELEYAELANLVR